MLSIKELKEQFDIQGGYCIKTWIEEDDDMEVIAQGRDFECEWYDIEDEYLDAEITYMYAVDGILNIEIEL